MWKQDGEGDDAFSERCHDALQVFEALKTLRWLPGARFWSYLPVIGAIRLK